MLKPCGVEVNGQGGSETVDSVNIWIMLREILFVFGSWYKFIEAHDNVKDIKIFGFRKRLHNI